MAGPEGGNDDGVGVSSIDNVAGFLSFLFISATTLENIYFYGFGTLFFRSNRKRALRKGCVTLSLSISGL